MIFTILVLLSIEGFSQTSFKMQVDTNFLVRYDDPYPHIASCVDGGIGIAAAASYESILLKYDSFGNFEWSKIGRENVNDFSFDGLELIPARDSGFYMKTEDEPDQFGWFGFPVIQKFDKFGNVTYSVNTSVIGTGTQGNRIFLSAVEKHNNNLHGRGLATFYDPVTETVCCGQGYGFKFDSTLTLKSKLRPSILCYNSLDEPYYILPSSNISSNHFTLTKYDTTGNIFEKIYYFHDSTEMRFLGLLSSCQDRTNIYMLNLVKVNSVNFLAIHKTDLAGNTEYFKVIDSTLVLPTQSIFSNILINKSDTGNVFLSAVAGFGTATFSSRPFMMELDPMGNVIYAWKGDGSDSMYVDHAIDTTSNAVLFLNAELVPGWWYNLKFQKEYPSSPSCGFIQLAPILYSVTITDSVAMDSSSFIIGTEPHTDNSLYLDLPYFVVPSTPICGVLSGTNDIDSELCDIEVYPNPANEFINLYLNCDNNIYSSIVIINLLGSEIPISGLVRGEKHFKINTKEMSNGIYSILLRLKDGTTSCHKIIVQH